MEICFAFDEVFLPFRCYNHHFMGRDKSGHILNDLLKTKQLIHDSTWCVTPMLFFHDFPYKGRKH